MDSVEKTTFTSTGGNLTLYAQIICGLRDRFFSSNQQCRLLQCLDTLLNLYPRQAIGKGGRCLGTVAKISKTHRPKEQGSIWVDYRSDCKERNEVNGTQ